MITAAGRREVLVDERWRGQHGIGRYATEVLDRLSVGWEPLELDGSPSSPTDALRALPASSKTALLYSPGYNGFMRASRELLTVHDLIHLETPGASGLKYRAYYDFLLRPIVRRTGAVMTVSETSRAAIQDWLGDDSVRVVNAGIGSSRAFSVEGEAQTAVDPYLMYVGNLRTHKNVAVVVAALRSLPGVRLRLLLPSAEHADAQRIAQEHGVGDRVDLLEGLTDQELAEYYRGAAATLMPSLREGFGLPPLESVFCGTPVVYWSGCAAVAETVGDRGTAVQSSSDPDEWAHAIEPYLGSRSRVEPPSRSDYSWDRTAAVVSAAIEGTMR